MESEQSRGWPTVDPHAADRTKVTPPLVREDRSLLRCADKLGSAVRGADDITTTRLTAEACRAVEQLVHQLTHLQKTQQCRAREAIRRGRCPPR
ncbi:MAG: hypothetical protein M3R48_08865 [Candidatus Dormibacteraeota bacterium]|nr:hypothetical protein [Candidatus Dormibacteraeota bacterium]